MKRLLIFCLIFIAGCGDSNCQVSIWKEGSGWVSEINDIYCESSAMQGQNYLWKQCNKYDGIVGPNVNFDLTHWTCDVYLTDSEYREEVDRLKRICNESVFYANWKDICNANSKLLEAE